MAGFDLGFGLGGQIQQRQQAIAQEAKIAQREERAKLYESALNNPNISPGDRQQLMAGLTSLYAPHEAPSLIERLSGLIHGATKATAKSQGETAQALVGAPNASGAQGTGAPGVGVPTPATAPTTPGANPATASGPTVAGGGVGNAPDSSNFGIGAGPSAAVPSHPLATGTPGVNGVPTPIDTAAASGGPMHPFATQHPAIAALQAGIDNIGASLKGAGHGFMHPPGFNQPPVDDSALLASAYRSPEQVAIDQQQRAAAQAQTLAEIHNQGLKAVAGVRALANPHFAHLENYAQDHGYESYALAPPEIRAAADADWVQSQLHPTHVLQTDPNNPGGFVTTFVTPKPGESIATVPPRGTLGTTTSSTKQDPYGNVSTTSTTRKPIIPTATGGLVPSGSVTAPSAPISSNAPASPTSLSNLATTVNSRRTSAATSPTSSKAPKSLPPLDDTGHIPANFGNPNVTAAANQLLSGTDIKEIKPAAVVEPASALARQYGWDRTQFTSKEQTALDVGTSFIQQLRNDPSLKVLDNLDSRLKLQRLIGSEPTKLSLLKSIPINVAGDNLTPAEADYLRKYNRLIGTIQGIASITRGSGRGSEAAVERFVQEIPNPYTSTSSGDANARLDNLMEEINTAKGDTVAARSRKGNAPVSTAAPGQPEKEVHDKNGKLLGYTRDGKTFSRLP